MKGKRSYDREVRDECFNLFVEGKSYREICELTKVKTPDTICAWVKKYKWKEKRDKILLNVGQKTDEKKADALAKLTDKHAAAAGNLIGIATFQIDLYVRPIKKFIEARKRGEKVEPPKINTHEIRRLTAILKDAIAVERQAYGLSMSDVAVEARIKKELFEFDRSALKPKQRKALDELESEAAVLIEGGLTADDNLEDYRH